MQFEDQHKVLTNQTKNNIVNEASKRKTGARSLLSQKHSKRAFSKRVGGDTKTYKAEETDRNSVQNQVLSIKMGKSHASSKHSVKDLSKMFHKNLNYLVKSKNLRRKKRDNKKNKLGEGIDFSAKYSSKNFN